MPRTAWCELGCELETFDAAALAAEDGAIEPTPVSLPSPPPLPIPPPRRHRTGRTSRDESGAGWQATSCPVGPCPSLNRIRRSA